MEDPVGHFPGGACRGRVFDIRPVSNDPPFGNAIFGEQESETVLSPRSIGRENLRDGKGPKHGNQGKERLHRPIITAQMRAFQPENTRIRGEKGVLENGIFC